MIAPRTPAVPLTALVLTAGLGTRLEPLTYVRAKAAVPVNGDTLARRVIRWLTSFGIHDFVLNLHHLPASITASVGDGSDLHARVRYSWENPVLGSAGGPRHALPLLIDPAVRSQSAPGSREPRVASRDETTATSQKPAASSQQPFLIVNGDTLTDVNIAAMLAAHLQSDASVTMALIPNPRPDKYGGVTVSDGGLVTGFSRAGSSADGYHFIGVQIAEARVFESLEDGLPAQTVGALYPQMIAADKHSVAAFVCDASFRDIGTPADYFDTSTHLVAEEGDRRRTGRGEKIDPTASIVRTAVWDDVTVGPGAELTECIVCDGAQIPAGARFRRSAIVPATGREPKAGQRIEGNLLIAGF
jgi:NDP-sugar pyrophosphorylase family protein